MGAERSRDLFNWKINLFIPLALSVFAGLISYFAGVQTSDSLLEDERRRAAKIVSLEISKTLRETEDTYNKVNEFAYKEVLQIISKEERMNSKKVLEVYRNKVVELGLFPFDNNIEGYKQNEIHLIDILTIEELEKLSGYYDELVAINNQLNEAIKISISNPEYTKNDVYAYLIKNPLERMSKLIEGQGEIIEIKNILIEYSDY